LRQTPISINFASFVGQGSIRSSVMGLVNRKATPEEIEKMKELAAQAMRDGAFGLSTGLFYVPGNFTPTEEVIDLAKVVGRMGGIHISHMREEASHVLDSVRETIRIGEEGGLPTQITHHKMIGGPNWGKSLESLKLVEEARARGVDVTIDQYPYTASSTGISALFPQWALEGGQKSTVERLSALANARASKLRSSRPSKSTAAQAIRRTCRSSIAPSTARSPARISPKSRRRAAQPRVFENAADTAIDLVSKGGCSAIYHAISEDDVARIMRSPYTMIASDGEIPVFGEESPHPRSYGTFARVLGF
jgi:dihydroorotase/N-acyl-D-amino-acid deacylase